MQRTLIRLCISLILAPFVASPAPGQWLQFGGPTRDFKVPAQKPLSPWAETGPKKLWERELGEGYSSILAEDGKLYTMYHKDGDEIVICLAADTGKTIWEHKYPVPGAEKGASGYGVGPRSTPTIVGNRIFTVGITGVFHCLDKSDGKVIWVHRLLEEFGGKLPQWGIAASPLAYEESVIIPAGGKGKAVVSFNQADGQIVWATGADENAYSSPVLIKLDGQDQVVVLMANAVRGINPKTGEELWSFPHKTFAEVNAALPVFGPDNVLLITSAYRTGSEAIKLTRKGEATEATRVWVAEKNGVHHGAVVRVGDVFYGSVGMMGPAFMTAMDNSKNGEVIWKEREPFRKATFLLVGDQLLVIDEGGTLGLASVSREGMKVHCKTKLLDEPAWTVPTLIDTKAYIRDRKKIMALDLVAG
jgi:outer membrane protein assembly factor BamB